MENMAKFLFFASIIVFTARSAIAFGRGAPPSTCLTMYPKHHVKQQTTASPFLITTSVTSYRPSQTINLTLGALDKRVFVGIELTAHAQSGDTEKRLGHFTVLSPQEKMHTIDCFGEKDKMVTHKNNNPITEGHVTWQAPDRNVGNITFRATFVQSFEVFWLDVTSDISSEVPMEQPLVDQVDMSPISTDFDSCGDTVGCMLYPSFCSGTDCDAGMTYRTENDNVTFTIFARVDNYVSIGFSHDRSMGEDHTISCLLNNKGVMIQNGYNPMLYNTKLYKDGQLENMRTSFKDGVLYCSFRRPKRMSLYYDKAMTFDLDTEFYVQLAWGPIYDGTQVMQKHIEMPVTSLSKIDFNKHEMHARGSALPVWTQIHGVLSLVAWILFAGITTVVSRYYKPMFVEKVICGTKVWFQVHRTFGILTGVVMASAFIIIFVKVWGLTKISVVHGWVGIAVMSAVFLQIVGGFLRPDAKSDFRSVFNWAHWFLGKSSHILAAACILLAFDADVIGRSQRKFGITMATIWIGLQFVWEVLFELRKCCVGKRSGEKYEVKDKKNGVSKLDSILFGLYIITMVAVTGVSLVSIFAF